MDREANVQILLERMLHDASVEPTNLPISLLKSITHNFSHDQQIGSGGFAVVFKVSKLSTPLVLINIVLTKNLWPRWAATSCTAGTTPKWYSSCEETVPIV